jgi:hypothetical protein
VTGVYYPYMASIVGKRRGKQTYYYLVESARVQGKPRIVSQQYLGSADEVIAKLSETPAGQPVRSRHKRFGDLAAVWSMLVRLDVAGIVDEVVPRYANAAATVGTYLALACANRVVDPCSKRGFADWWETTAGGRWVKLDRAAVDHRRFWDAMDRLGEAELREIETRLGGRMVTEFGLDLTGLALDMTNFATFIDTGNAKAPIAQRGKAKQKRTDLRLVGLALVVTRDGGVPVISHAYPGDRPDVTQFPAVIDELVARYRDLDQTLAKARRRLAELQARLARGATRRDRAAVQAEIATICKPRWVADIITVTLTGERPAELRLSWRSDTGARKRLEQRLFGKRILFTNRDWPVPEVVAAYRSQSDAEFGFRQLKDPHVVSFSPMHHWTDTKIRVHIFYCVLALTVAHLMRRHAAQAGLHLSVRELLDHLAGIEETVLLYHDGGKGRPRVQRILTDTTPTQQRLADLFTIHQYAPTR